MISLTMCAASCESVSMCSGWPASSGAVHAAAIAASSAMRLPPSLTTLRALMVPASARPCSVTHAHPAAYPTLGARPRDPSVATVMVGGGWWGWRGGMGGSALAVHATSGYMGVVRPQSPPDGPSMIGLYVTVTGGGCFRPPGGHGIISPPVVLPSI